MIKSNFAIIVYPMTSLLITNIVKAQQHSFKYLHKKEESFFF